MKRCDICLCFVEVILLDFSSRDTNYSQNKNTTFNSKILKTLLSMSEIGIQAAIFCFQNDVSYLQVK